MYNGPEHYLDSDVAAGRFMAHARLLLKLSRRFEAIAPAAFRHAARVANYKSGTVVIHTDNGAVASKIRQMSQRLCGELSKGGAQCNDMEVKVQPREILSQSTTSTPKPISGEACEALRASAEKLPKGPLRAALDRLLERAARRD
ncbi:MAG: DciA family protein [Azonexus sp.]